MRPLMVMLAGLGLLGCAPRIAPGQFRCDPARLDSCPAGWLCLPWADEFRCFEQVGICGNFVLEAGEECDGTDFAGRVCADHYDDSGSMVPHCDDRCRVVCPRCGNGIVDQDITHIYGISDDATDFEEACDHGAMNSDSAPDACRTDCTPARCGDGVVDSDDSIDNCPEDCGVKDIAALGFVCVLKGDGTVWCWMNCSGGLGDSLGTTDSDTPVRVAGLTEVRDVSVGGDHACAILADDTVHCWGTNDEGQLGDGTTDTRPTPAPVPVVSDASDVACGGTFTCAVRQDQSVWCWGGNEYATLGDGLLQHPECDPLEECGGADRSTVPVEVALPAGAHAVVAGITNACALLVDGTAACWGLNEKSQLGDGLAAHEVCDADYDCSPVPVQVRNLTEVRQLAIGQRHTCAVVGGTPRQVWCWGYNGIGQVGAPTVAFLETSTPHQVEGLENPLLVAAGESHSCAVEADGSVWCWGSNYGGEFGLGYTGPASSSPVRAGASDVIKLAAVFSNNFSVRRDGTAWAWGLNADYAVYSAHVSELLGDCARD